MISGRQEKLQERVERLVGADRGLREQVRALKKEIGGLQRNLREARQLLWEIPGGVALIQGGRILLANGVAFASLGYSQDEILDRDFLELLHPDSVAEVRTRHRRRLAGKAVPDRYEANLLGKDGSKIRCEVRVRKIRYRGRNAFLLHLIDLRGRKRSEREQLLAEKDKALLCMIRGLFRTLQGCPETPDSGAVPALTSMAGRTNPPHGLASLLRQLQILAEDEVPHKPKVRFDLRKVLREAVQTCRSGRRVGDGGELNIKTYLRALSPVEGDPDRLREAVEHILDNAADALPGGGEIYLTSEESGGFVHVYVQDNGHGIPEEVRDRIFDPFFTTGDGSRLGLGLSLAQSILRHHGGEIEVLSREQHGSTFVVKVPAAGEESPPEGRSRKRSIRGSRVLIVVGDTMAGDLLCQVLSSRGCQIASAASGAEALRLLARESFDLVLLDLAAPGLASPEVLPALRKKTGAARLGLICLSAGRGSPLKEEEPAADFVVGPPLDLDRVLSLAAQALNRQGAP